VGTTVPLPASVRAAVLTAENSATVGLAVLDTRTGRFYGSAGDEQQFPAESVVKVLIAANLLATGQMSGNTEQLAYQMITESDDDDADALWGLVGGPDVLAWAEQRYGISDLGAPPIESGWWGNTKFTARGLVELYAAIKADPVVGPWLLGAMSTMAATADDGTDQDFGLAAQNSAGAFKQGWGGDDDADNSEQLNSTGLLDGERYAVAVLVQHVPYEPMADLLPVIDALAAGVDPGGQVVAPVPPPPPAPPSSTSSAAPVTTTAPAAAAASSPPSAAVDAGSVQAARSSRIVALLTGRTRLAVIGTATLVCLGLMLLLLLARHRRQA
jgi:hypothetical protein